METEVVDDIFSNDNIVDGVAGVCLSLCIGHGDVWQIFGDDIQGCYIIGKQFIVGNSVHEKADRSEIDPDKRELVGLVFFDRIKHKAIATSDEDSVRLFWVTSKTLRVTSDIVLERCCVFFWAEEGEVEHQMKI